eukprot:1189535-Prorocentrum_minimum.AAC.1
MVFQLVCERCKLYSGNVTVRTCREDKNHDGPDSIVSAYPVGSLYLVVGSLRSLGQKSGTVSVQGHGAKTIKLAYVDAPEIVWSATTRQANGLKRVGTNAPIGASVLGTGIAPLGRSHPSIYTLPKSEVDDVQLPPSEEDDIPFPPIIPVEPTLTKEEVLHHLSRLSARSIVLYRVRSFTPTALDELLSHVQPRVASFGEDEIPYSEIKKTLVWVGVNDS